MPAFLQNMKTGEIRILTSHQAAHPDMKVIDEKEAKKIMANNKRSVSARKNAAVKVAKAAQKDRDAVTKAADKAEKERMKERKADAKEDAAAKDALEEAIAKELAEAEDK